VGAENQDKSREGTDIESRRVSRWIGGRHSKGKTGEAEVDNVDLRNRGEQFGLSGPHLTPVCGTGGGRKSGRGFDEGPTYRPKGEAQKKKKKDKPRGST